MNARAGVSHTKPLILIRMTKFLIAIPVVNNILSSSTKFLKNSFTSGLPSPHQMPTTNGRIVGNSIN